MDLHITESGSGSPALFLHAGVADSRMWRDQVGLDGVHSIAFDKRGFGQSPDPTGPYSDTDDAIAVLDHVGVGAAVVVGCSMGAATALEMAIDHPERVDGLVLVGGFPSGWEPDEWEESPLEAEAMAAAKAGDLERVVEIDSLMWLVGYGRDGSSIDPALRDLFADMDSRAVRSESVRNEHQTGFQKGLNEYLGEIGLPTLVIVGSNDEALLIEAAHYMASRLGNGDPVVIEDAAHLPSLEKPAEFNSVLLDFINR